MTDTDILVGLVDRSVLGLTLWGEARGESTDGRLAVGGVIKNRMSDPAHYRATAATWKAVCLAPLQFSCWNQTSDTNHSLVMAQAERIYSGLPIEDADMKECLFLADGLMQGVFQDRSKGAQYYLETVFYRKDPPRWAATLMVTATIGSQTFFKEVTA